MELISNEKCVEITTLPSKIFLLYFFDSFDNVVLSQLVLINSELAPNLTNLLEFGEREEISRCEFFLEVGPCQFTQLNVDNRLIHSYLNDHFSNNYGT